jgi:hypothetical protein
MVTINYDGDGSGGDDNNNIVDGDDDDGKDWRVRLSRKRKEP